MISILENNKNCSREKKVDLKVFFYIQDKDDKSVERLKSVCALYDVELQISDASEYVEALKEAGDKPYNNSFIIDLFLVVPSVLDVDYNILFLQSDVVMNYGLSLIDLAEYDWGGYIHALRQ